MRGVAIIGIALHNYCHWLPGIIRENEYQFMQKNVDGLSGVLSAPDSNLPLHLLSFFGHYGVPLFLFLSAYGLGLKYERPLPQGGYEGKKVGIWPFLSSHFVKLFRMMFAGFAAFLMVYALMPDSHHYTVEQVMAQLTMTINFMPNPDRMIWPGPYWFFGLMMQLYVIYRLLLYRRHWGVTVGLTAVCMVAQMLCDPEGETLNYLHYNFIGSMLPFGVGLLTARYGQLMSRRMCAIMLLPSLYMVYYFATSWQLWQLAPLAVVFTAICFVKSLGITDIDSGNPLRVAYRPLQWVGSVSAAMFVCHPITRKLFIPMSYHGDTYLGLLVYAITTIALSWLFNKIISLMANKK